MSLRAGKKGQDCFKRGRGGGKAWNLQCPAKDASDPERRCQAQRHLSHLRARRGKTVQCCHRIERNAFTPCWHHSGFLCLCGLRKLQILPRVICVSSCGRFPRLRYRDSGSSITASFTGM